jgi:uncharacterized protein (TIGR04255 family)
MGKPLKNPPVYFTVVQVRFNAVLNLKEKYLPLIQDGLRKMGYPVYLQKQAFALHLEGGQGAPKMVPIEQYFFSNPAQTHVFVLGNEALTFQSTDYGNFESFSEAFLKGLALVHDVVELAFTQRIGLRYLDFVLPKEGEPLELYLHAGVFGLSAELGGASIHAFTESLTQHGQVQLRSRIVLQDGSVAFPPDIAPDDMKLQPRFLEGKGRHAILDSDGFVEERQDYSLGNVKSRLIDIHKVIGGAFKKATTEHAHQVWEE